MDSERKTCFFNLRLKALERERGVEPADSYLTKVRKYYDYATPLILPVFGLTYQLGTRSPDSKVNNLFFAERAGVVDGESVLDAGCGWGGPALDVAEAYPKCVLTGVTISGRQHEVMSEEIQRRGMADRVSAVRADYHNLPFEDDLFDRVYFLESSGHSEDPVSLFQEMRRVLKSGGFLYLKEPFLRSCALRETRQQEVSAVETIYTHKLCSLKETLQWLKQAGFVEIEGEDISHLLDQTPFWSAMRDQKRQLTPFGRAHSFGMPGPPLFMGEVRARKP